MNGEGYFEYRPPEIRSLNGTESAMNKKTFEQNVWIEFDRLTEYTYAPERGRRSIEWEQRKGPEALYDKASSTLAVFPPTPGAVGVKDIAAMTVPVVRFIEDTQPDIVIGCDRGARIYAIGVQAMWSQLHSERFPSLDTSLRFARLSTSIDRADISRALARIIHTSMEEGKQWNNDWNAKRPRLLFIDDWIVSGKTRKHILESLEVINVLPGCDVSFAVMCGGSADASGRIDPVTVPWHDDPTTIGINYTKTGQPFPVRSKEALNIRRKLHNAVKSLARTITSDGRNR